MLADKRRMINVESRHTCMILQIGMDFQNRNDTRGMELDGGECELVICW